MNSSARLEKVAKLETFARIGHAARGVVYFLLGYLALTTAEGSDDGAVSVFRQVRDLPLSTPVLILVGLGLLGWGIFRLYGAIFDIDGEGTDFKGVGTRLGHALSGLMHIVLCYAAIRFALGSGTRGSGGQRKETAASTAEQLPLGETLISLVALGFAVAALQQFAKAWSGKFKDKVGPDTPEYVEWLGRAGYAARGAVFAALSWQVFEVALSNASARQVGLGGALEALRATSWLFPFVAIGLILFGLFSLAMARYRTVRDENVFKRLAD